MKAFALSVLKEWPVIIGISKQENLLSVHKKMGYDYLGKIPRLFDGGFGSGFGHILVAPSHDPQ